MSRAARVCVFVLASSVGVSAFATCVMPPAADEAAMACCVQGKHDCAPTADGERCCTHSIEGAQDSLTASPAVKAPSVVWRALPMHPPVAIAPAHAPLRIVDGGTAVLPPSRSAPLYVLDSVFRI